MRFHPRNKTTQRKSTRFAWLPKRMANGTWIWLESYRSIPLGEYKEYGQ